MAELYMLRGCTYLLLACLAGACSRTTGPDWVHLSGPSPDPVGLYVRIDRDGRATCWANRRFIQRQLRGDELRKVEQLVAQLGALSDAASSEHGPITTVTIVSAEDGSVQSIAHTLASEVDRKLYALERELVSTACGRCAQP